MVEYPEQLRRFSMTEYPLFGADDEKQALDMQVHMILVDNPELIPVYEELSTLSSTPDEWRLAADSFNGNLAGDGAFLWLVAMMNNPTISQDLKEELIFMLLPEEDNLELS